MPKIQDATAVADASKAAAESAPATDFPLSLDEFCMRLSSTDKRTELIGAFNHVEKLAGRLLDTDGNFRARFEAFASQPA